MNCFLVKVFSELWMMLLIWTHYLAFKTRDIFYSRYSRENPHFHLLLDFLYPWHYIEVLPTTVIYWHNSNTIPNMKSKHKSCENFFLLGVLTYISKHIGDMGSWSRLLKNILKQFNNDMNERKHLILIHFSPMFHFYAPWKPQQSFGFLKFSGGIDIKH